MEKEKRGRKNIKWVKEKERITAVYVLKDKWIKPNEKKESKKEGEKEERWRNIWQNKKVKEMKNDEEKSQNM